MPYTPIAKNMMLDALCRAEAPVTPIGDASLHSGFPGNTGANEISGGSPSYARKSITFNKASAGSSDSSNQPVFDVDASTTIRFVGYFASGSPDEFLAYAPIGNVSFIDEFSVDVAGDNIDAIAHPFSNDQNIVFLDGTAPGGLTEGTVYFVVNSATDLFQVSLTQGGGAITLTDQGDDSVEVHRIVEETFGAQGTFTLTDADLDLNA